MDSMILLVAMIAVFYFLIIRPENKRKKQAENMRNSLKKGERITTIGGLVGRIVLKLIGVVWAVASVFAIPALVCDAELTNPFTALKRSASIIRRTWGETLIGFAGLHVITGVGVFLFFLAVFGVGALVGAAGGGAVPVIAGTSVGILLFLCLFAFCYLVSVAEKVYIASLYLYATDYDEYNLFDEEELAAAFRFRK